MLKGELSAQMIKDLALVIFGIIILASLFSNRVNARSLQFDVSPKPGGGNQSAAPVDPDLGKILADNVSLEAAVWVTCTPLEVMPYVNAQRIHVKCAESYSGIRYFAQSTTDTASVARSLSVLTTAQVAGRTLTIRYDPDDLSGANIGCLTSDCRLIIAVGFGQ